MSRRDPGWLVADWPDGATLRELQLLATGLLRLQVVIAFRPARRLLRRLLGVPRQDPRGTTH